MTKIYHTLLLPPLLATIYYFSRRFLHSILLFKRVHFEFLLSCGFSSIHIFHAIHVFCKTYITQRENFPVLQNNNIIICL